MSKACCIHLKDAGNHAASHFYGTRKLGGAVRALNNNPPALLHLGDATGRY